jgi:hypothetical protein
LPPPPRRTRRRRGRGALRGFLPLLLLPHMWCGALLPLWTVRELVDVVRFYHYGHVVPGQIQRLHIDRGKGGPYHRVVYTYPLAGAEGTGEATVDEAVYGWLAVGDAVEVRVLPGFRVGPQLLVEGTRGPAIKVWELFVITLIWDGLMAVFVCLAIVPPLRQRKLVQLGVAAPGWVTNKYETKGKGHSYNVCYRYTAPAPATPGEDMEYQAEMTVRGEDYDRVRAEDRVTVLYDPRKPRRSLVCQCADYEAR